MYAVQGVSNAHAGDSLKLVNCTESEQAYSFGSVCRGQRVLTSQ